MNLCAGKKGLVICRSLRNRKKENGICTTPWRAITGNSNCAPREQGEACLLYVDQRHVRTARGPGTLPSRPRHGVDGELKVNQGKGKGDHLVGLRGGRRRLEPRQGRVV